MREFGIRFSKGLRKGLRSYPTSAPGSEMLIECFNLQPCETGLKPRDEVSMVDATLNFTYFCMRSEVGDVWCTYIDSAGQINTVLGPPDPIDGYAAENESITPLPRYVQMEAINEPGLELYLYPNVAGSLTVDYAPPGGDGYEVAALHFLSPNGYMYDLAVINTLQTIARQMS